MHASNDTTATYEFRNPYAAPAAHVAPEPPAYRYERAPTVAGRASRLLAYFIDVGATLLALVPGFVAIETLEANGEPGVAPLMAMALSGMLLLALIIYNLIRLATHAQTLGKQVVGIRIVRSDGDDASFLRILGLRILLPSFIGAIPFVGAVFSLINVLWIFGEEKRCLHDLMADTIVVG